MLKNKTETLRILKDAHTTLPIKINKQILGRVISEVEEILGKQKKTPYPLTQVVKCWP